ncbi:hypothetical protein BX666DRAFT_1877165 [Dichotomocladium elegans]|nr:hypothetical protein BX666DRAFT_1877165 [Dichotomocladium elegans]
MTAVITTSDRTSFHDPHDRWIQKKNLVRLILEEDHPHPALSHFDDICDHHDVHPEASTHEPKELIKRQKETDLIVHNSSDTSRTKDSTPRPDQRKIPGSTKHHLATIAMVGNAVNPSTPEGNLSSSIKKPDIAIKTDFMKENKLLRFLSNKKKKFAGYRKPTDRPVVACVYCTLEYKHNFAEGLLHEEDHP